MIRRTLRFDSIDGMWRMDEQQYEEMITDNEFDAMQAQWIADEAARIKRQRRDAAINRALTFAIALVVIGLVLIVLGVLR